MQPSLTFYPASGIVNNGTAVIICPGGSFCYLHINTEGAEVARWLNKKGVAAFVLQYRLVHSETAMPVKEKNDRVWIGAVFPAAPVQVDAQKIVRKLLQVRGLHNYNYEDFISATGFIENNYEKYPFGDLVEKEYLLEHIEEVFVFAGEQKPVRVGIKMADIK